jgi:O-antigen/teichoic acid export membrane protein
VFLRILTSNWIAIPVLIVAAILLVALHISGMTTEALIGGAILVIAAYLILTGKRRDTDPNFPP